MSLEHAAMLLGIFPCSGPFQQFLQLKKGHVENVYLNNMEHFPSTLLNYYQNNVIIDVSLSKQGVGLFSFGKFSMKFPARV